MKNFFIFIPTLLSLIFTIGKTAYCEELIGIGYSWENPMETQKVYELEELDEAMMQKWLEGQGDEMILHFREGTILPVNFSVNGDLIKGFAQAPQAAMPIQISQDFYIKIQKDDIQFAKELGNWEPFEKFTTGEIKASILNRGPEGFVINMEGIFFLRKDQKK